MNNDKHADTNPEQSGRVFEFPRSGHGCITTALTYMSDGEIAKKIAEMFDLRPKAIERQLKLRQPMFQETAAYGHMGRKNEIVEKTFTSRYHEAKTVRVELFTWEKLDKVDEIKKVFGL